MKKRLIIPLMVFVLVFLVACSSESVTEAPATQPAPDGAPTEDGYPGPESIGPGYPVENNVAEQFEQSLTPNAPPPEFSSDTGAFSVALRYPDGERPVRGQLFFAAGTIPVEGVEDGFIPVLDQTNDPKGHSDAQGVLVISNLAPGRYALALMTPLGPILLEYADTSETIIFEITAGEVTDLGTQAVFLNAETLEP